MLFSVQRQDNKPKIIEEKHIKKKKKINRNESLTIKRDNKGEKKARKKYK